MYTRALTFRDGTPLFLRIFDPRAPARGTIVIVHGALEHGVYYEHLAQRLYEQGWLVLIPDLRGLGQSGGPRMHISTFDQYLADLDDLLEHTGTHGPLVLVGHSMGGLISTRYAQTRPGRVQALVLSAPLLGVSLQINPWVLAIGWKLAKLLPRFRFRSGLRGTQLSRSVEYLERRRHDPLIRGKVTAGWFRESQLAIQKAIAEADAYSGPVLLLQGQDDRVTDGAAALRWGRARNAEVHELPVQKHAIFQEPEREQTFQIIENWLERVLPAPGAAP